MNKAEDLATELMGKITLRENLNQAYKRVKANKVAPIGAQTSPYINYHFDIIPAASSIALVAFSTDSLTGSRSNRA
ncbi:MAG: hypothetical protein H0U71_02390 [Gammaproteobacteria bacterium]|nr:hypothetical protein [Gammaproteobacteria bacterium]